MIDRYGKKVSIYWAEHELEWVRAAMTLPFRERQEAYRDISAMTTRPLQAVRDRATTIKTQEKRYAARMEKRVSAPSVPKVCLPPSQLRPPTMAQLMGCR